jgi:hypothetical protein
MFAFAALAVGVLARREGPCWTAPASQEHRTAACIRPYPARLAETMQEAPRPAQRTLLSLPAVVYKQAEAG